MPKQVPQTYANHTRRDPPFHLFLLPVVAITLLYSIWNLIRNPGWAAAWWVVLMAAAAVAVLKVRVYALKVQDRLIRLEERMRLSSLLAEPLRSRIGELTEAQLVALRFASDAEIPALVEKALANQWKRDEIKKAIVQWRPDYFRV